MIAGQLHRLVNDYFGDKAVQRIVTYFRVSTAKQGQSGLGLEGQQAAVDAFVARRGCEVLASYTEVESGKLSVRPQLAKALAHAKRAKATLVVAKLDRLARNVHFMSSLMESRVDFLAIDLEHANRLTIHILSAVAEGEAKAISDRTKAALAAAKARGVKLGSARPGHWDGHEEARRTGGLKGLETGRAVLKKAAKEAYADLIPEMQGLRTGGKTLQEIADALNSQGHTTRRGKSWNAVQVMRVLGRAT
ncbi:MAG: recombinase family protein [Planctomycetes bacterium]|nr:recombinase family protein [Planctomycetota bacterium]